MKGTHFSQTIVCWLVLAVTAQVAAASPFSYQGELLVAGVPAEGEYDFLFSLFDAEEFGVEVATSNLLEEVEVQAGIFTSILDFGDVFDGTPLWLEIQVKEAGTIGAFEPLTPRQPITAAPGAIFSETANDADTLDGLDSTDLTIQGLALNGTVLEITEGATITSVDLAPLQAADGDTDASNEFNTGVSLSGNTLEVTDAGGTLTADLSSLVNDADPDPTNELITSASLVSNVLTLIESGAVTNLVDLSTLLNASLTLTGTDLSLTDAGGTLTVDLAPLQDGVDDADNDPTNELNTGLALSGTDLELTDSGGTLTVDLAPIQDGVNDADPDPTNELITSANLTNGNQLLEVVEGGNATNLINVAPLLNSTLVLSGTELQLADGGGTLTADLSTLQDGVDDADNDPTNELNTSLTLSGTDLEVVDSGGTLSADLSSLGDDADADPLNELITSTTLTNGNTTIDIVEAGNLTNSLDVSPLLNSTFTVSGSNLELTDGGGTVSVDLSALQDGIDDADADPTNELNSSLTLSGTDLELVDASGTLTADLSSLAADADSDSLNELITSAQLLTNDNSTLEIVEGTLTNLVDLSALQNATLTLAGTDLSLVDGGGTLVVDLSSLDDDDADADPANELNSALVLNGTLLQLTDAGGTLSADLAALQDGVIDPDADPANELIDSASLTLDNLLQIVEAGATNTVDLSSLAGSSLASLYDNFGWAGASAPVGVGPGAVASPNKILEIVDSLTSNRFEVDFNRIQPGVIIDSLPFTISQPGFYYLTGNLTNSTTNGDGIIINSSEVTLDLKGYTLYGGKLSGVNSDDGIFVLGSETNITIRNGSVVGWQGDGINALNADFSIYQDLHVSWNEGDGLVGDFNNLMVRVTAYSNGLDGIEGDDGTVILNSTAGQNGDNGIQTSEGTVVALSASFDNRSDGVDVAAGSVVNTVAVSDNGLFGVDLALGGFVVNSNAYDNMSNGFDIASSSVVYNVHSALNNGHGVRTFANAWIRGSKFHENDLDGIRVSSQDTLVEENFVTDNDQTGIAVTSSGTMLVRNVAAGNLTNYNFNAFSAFGPIIDVTGAGDISLVPGADHPWANFTF